MSLTGSDGLFAAVHENGINDFIAAYFNARPRYLTLGSSFFVPSTTVTATRVDAIDIGGGIHFLVSLERPVVDLHPDTFGFGLPPGPNQFSIEVKARLTILCRKRRGRQDDTGKQPSGEPLSTSLAICGTGHIERVGNELRLVVDEVEIKDITPDTLESIIECIMRMVISEALEGLRIPYNSVFIGIGNINPSTGPLIADDQVKVTANFV